MNAYVYCAALLCTACVASSLGTSEDPRDVARGIERERRRHRIPDGATDTDNVPDGPHGDGGGESDSPQHCDSCGVFLRNPLTSEGRDYVRDAIQDYNDSKDVARGDVDVLRTWRDFYADSVQRFGMTDLPEIED